MNKKYVLEKLAMQWVRTDEQILQPEDPLTKAFLFGTASAVGSAIGTSIMSRRIDKPAVVFSALASALPVYYLTNKHNEERIANPEQFVKKSKEDFMYKFLKKLEKSK